MISVQNPGFDWFIAALLVAVVALAALLSSALLWRKRKATVK